MSRRSLAVVALSGLALLALPAGIAAGRMAADRAAGIDDVAITLVGRDPSGPAAASASAVIRRDGAMVGLTGPGYATIRLDEATRSDLLALLRQGETNWSDAYLVPGGSTTRLSIAIAGSHPRTITVDSPLANTALPDSLYRFIVLAERQFSIMRPDAVDVAPPGLIVYTRPLPAAAGTTPLALPPGIVDTAIAGSADGERLDPDASSRLRAALPAASTFVYPFNAAAVVVDGRPWQITWVADWTAWAGAGS